VGGGEGQIANPYENISVPTRNLHAFPSGYQHKLAVHNRLTGMIYTFSGGCANLTPGIGIYSGTTIEEAIGGNLEFVPGAEWELVKNNEG
jgi:hypothetical protein